jgi:tyrosyl-tRNA synthetase
MDIFSRMQMVAREPTEEVVTNNELKTVFETIENPKHYIGIEISGKLHVGSLILTGFKINDFIKARVDSTIFLADWHTYINNKLGGNWDKIRDLSNYYSEAFKFFCPGVKVLLGSELYDNATDYWKNLVRFSKEMTLSRAIRSLTIMGRTEKDNLDLSQLFYPLMQSIDIKALDIDLVHAGMDQRKIHMLVREIFPGLGWKVPVSVHHHLLPGLSEPNRLGLGDDPLQDTTISSKMSKSKPSDGIMIDDDSSSIKEKVDKAFCPAGIVANNPILELVRYVIFHAFTEFVIERPSRYGGNITYTKYADIERDFVEKRIHPLDIKNATSVYIDKIIRPIRNHFKGRQFHF